MSTPDAGGRRADGQGPRRGGSVFADPTGRRPRWVLRIAVALGALLLAIAVLFTLSLLAVPVLPRVPGIGEAIRVIRPSFPRKPERVHERSRFLEARARKRLLTRIQADETAARAVAHETASSVVVGAFYAVWQGTGIHSLRANAGHLTHLFPVWLRLGPNADDIDTRDWNPEYSPHNLDVLQICRDHRIAIHPVLANAHEGVFDSTLAHVLLTDPARQRRLAGVLRDWLVGRGFAGLNVDLENLSAEDAARVPAFLGVLRRRFAPDSLKLSFDLQVQGEVPPAAAVARECDFVVLMGYDQHGRQGGAGPLCSPRWFSDGLDRALRDIPTGKLVIGYGAYAYDWTLGRPPAEPMTYQQALSTAADTHPGASPADIVDFDAAELNATYTYRDDEGDEHEVWMLDAISAANQRTLALLHGVRGSVLWVLGSEDPDVWTFLDRARPAARPDSSQLAADRYPFDVAFAGNGEILSVQSEPRAGARRLDLDHATGLFTDQAYSAFPTPYVIHREGFVPKALALTFDDGPSSPWTDDILDVLEADTVRATFFVIGQNAERHPDLVHRMWDEGHEIGNHSFTHPNLAAIPNERLLLELNATQRVIEADLGRSTIFFRPPYNADAEPTSAEEVMPILAASRLGYVTIGEYLDPQDWNLVTVDSTGRTRPRTAADIAAAVLAEVAEQRGNTLLFHDGGGDRSRTAAALRLVIPELKRRGFHFVTVSQLAGLTRDQVMPRLGADSRPLRGVDRLTFETVYLVETFLYYAFISAILLGAARVVMITVLALLSCRRRETFDPEYRPTVSVLIAAYNEHTVIARTLHAVLEGAGPELEVVVVDDGSADGTADEVERVFGGEPRVRLLRQANAGKAIALNRALAASRGEVVVCLDADTLFTPTTIPLLARHFVDPRVGAVAGNVKVGNRVNLWTRWQSIEYVVSQNLDRRAYAWLNAVTVVPGACGAWRRVALERAGGFVADTLAEDTDLTWRLRRAGWRLANEPGALAYTEAPDGMRPLLRQRFRWTYGTLQCLWKHRDALGRYGWFGRLALPGVWLFQIAYQVLSPIVDLMMVWTLWGATTSWVSRAWLTRDWQPAPRAMEAFSGVATLFVLFFVLELVGAAVAYRLDRERPRDLVWLFWQRFVYRQIMYAVALRAVRHAIEGRTAGWGKLQRKGTVGTAPA
jgi:cellulose synthase/poly-beta-1,6-N-acetylglucosamine synthase-like glycosyltransferase/peptidoglycan/xylan/chitin deacetylase (PgdA/CDA1 family)/spore germination protein YaaH